MGDRPPRPGGLPGAAPRLGWPCRLERASLHGLGWTDPGWLMLEEWTEPPPMSAVAPAPAVLSSHGTLWLAYRIARDPHHCAVIRFHGVQQYLWGPPPAVHGLDGLDALSQGSFYEVPLAARE